MIDRLERDMIRDEGWRTKPYRCTEGHLTIGVGHKLLPHEMDIQEASTEWIWSTLRQDAIMAIRGCEMIFGKMWDSFGQVRQRALANMVFQMGMYRVLGFKRMIDAIMRGDWVEASKEALDSKYARQTPVRARRVAQMLRTGHDEREMRQTA